MRTKIIATIGPKSESYDMILAFAKEGVSIFRMNFSHCTPEEYRARRTNVLRAGKELRVELSVLQDLQGPRIRVGKMPEGGRVLHDGDTITFSTSEESDDSIIHIDEPYLHADIAIGDPILLANGEMELVTTGIEGTHITAKVIRGGTLFSRKGVNVPHTKLTTSGLTEKDRADVAIALEAGVEYIAVSFVQTADDMRALKELVGNKAKLIAKIETRLAIENIDSIMRASDAVMIARGDLGIEMPLEQVPLAQKNLIRHAAWLGKGSITATQMLFSMVNHAHPTRAEVSDIAQAVWDGTDAVMLSDETASGDYPLEAVQTMARIVREAEKVRFDRENSL